MIGAVMAFSLMMAQGLKAQTVISEQAKAAK